MRLSARDLKRLPADFPARLKEAAPQADIAISQKPWETGGGFLLVTGTSTSTVRSRPFLRSSGSPLRDAVGRLLFAEG